MIPLFYFLLAWIVFLGLYGLMALMSIYQFMRFGIAQTGTWLTTVIFCTVTFLVVMGTGYLLIGVDWNQSLNLLGMFSVSAPAYLQ